MALCGATSIIERHGFSPLIVDVSSACMMLLETDWGASSRSRDRFMADKCSEALWFLVTWSVCARVRAVYSICEFIGFENWLSIFRSSFKFATSIGAS